METTFISLEYRVIGFAGDDFDGLGNPTSFRVALRPMPPGQIVGDHLELRGLSREDLRRFPLDAVVKMNFELPPVPLPVPGKNEDATALADRLCSQLAKYAGEPCFSGKGGTSEGATEVLERLLNELEGYRHF